MDTHSSHSSGPQAVSDLIVSCLEAEGVEYVFGIPGEENIWLVRSIQRSHKIRYVLVRHEAAASFMADIYGRLTGRAAVCSGTLGPGAINLLLGTADAQTCSVPLVALSAQVALNRIFKESHQSVDLVAMFRPVTKWADTVPTPQAVPEMVRKAFQLAQTGRPGATYLAIPQDLEELDAPPGLAPMAPTGVSTPLSSDAGIARAAELIAAARHPIVVAGHGVARAGASAALCGFVEAANLPVATTFHGKGVISDDHPNALGPIGFMRHDYENFSFDQSDLIIAVGYELQEFDPIKINPHCDKRVVHVHDLLQETDKAYRPVLNLIGEIGDSLKRLTARVTPRASLPADAQGARRMHEQELAHGAADASFPLKPQRVIADIRKALGDEDVLLADTGAVKMWLARLYPTKAPNTCIISNGLSTMSFALPGALGAKLALPNRKVLAAMGDGSFLMLSQEIETARREKIPLAVLIWEDGSYGLIKWKMDLELHEHENVDFTNPDFVKYAESFGAKGVRIAAAEELLPALQAALASDGVTVITCPVDYRENDKLTDMLGNLTSAG